MDLDHMTCQFDLQRMFCHGTAEIILLFCVFFFQFFAIPSASGLDFFGSFGRCARPSEVVRIGIAFLGVKDKQLGEGGGEE